MQTSELVHQSIDDVKLHSFLLQQQFKSLSTSLGFSEQSLDKPSDELKEEERMSSDTVRTETRPEIVSIEPEITKVEQVSYQLITEYKELERWCSIAENQGLVAIDTETTSINAASADLVEFPWLFLLEEHAIFRFDILLSTKALIRLVLILRTRQKTKRKSINKLILIRQ